jgi:hypothetical protein
MPFKVVKIFCSLRLGWVSFVVICIGLGLKPDEFYGILNETNVENTVNYLVFFSPNELSACLRPAVFSIATKFSGVNSWKCRGRGKM